MYEKPLALSYRLTQHNCFQIPQGTSIQKETSIQSRDFLKMAEQGVQTAFERNGTASEFRHQALPDPKTYIRLSKLDPVAIGDTTTKLNCEVTTWHVDRAPSYHAISYVWGDPTVTTKLKVNGKDLQITTNGEYALRQSRWFGALYVWMDSISIDQSDDKEKGHQVGMMGNIYRRASFVLSCVGPHSENSEVLMTIPCKSFIPTDEPDQFDDFTTRISCRYRRSLQMLNVFAWSVQTQNVEKETMFNSLYSFMQRPYFRRLWVLQEVSVGKDVIVCCGIDHRPITDLFGLRNLLHQAVSLNSSWFRLSRIRRLVDAVFFPHATLLQVLGDKREYSKLCMHMGSDGCKNVCHRYLEHGATDRLATFSLRYLWNVSIGLKCQDPRDKIYGLLSVVEWKDIPPIEPDYEIGAFDVALKAMETFQKQSTALLDAEALRLADSLNRLMLLHLAHETPKNTTLEDHTVREAKIEDLNSQCFTDDHWFSCEITKDHRNIWKLGIEFDSMSHLDQERLGHICGVHPSKTHCQQRFSFGNLEDRISNKYVQIKDHEGNLMALLPQGAKSGDLLVGVWVRFRYGVQRRTKTPRYLVLRKRESGYHTIFGQAIVAGACAQGYDNTYPWFRGYYDNRDVLNLIISWAQCLAYKEEDLSLMTWDMAKDLLDLKLCNQPFSSYALKQTDLSWSPLP
ncbi:b56f3dde-11e7-4c1d-8e5c-55f0ff29c365 [Sclerotinia trifoliorum]|uniref:B56f3dde-11e7-4c1d-8e5c-55f0ff29c365 n=1 Tax=Sclerotinia trifoliorum TaxID=28548 RepID=A0A8H2VWA7_9HELO|nr:b56f3dde-11e7-4c1d-8e5c-55f0ff29c365 [Sclerotinia trifoliorum]